MRRARGFLVVPMAALALLAGCTDGEGDGGDGPPDGAPPSRPDAGGSDGGEAFEFVRCDEDRAPLPPLVEDRRVYDRDPLDVWTVEVTVTDLDALAAVNAGVDGAEVPVVFADGGFGAGVVAPNAAMRIRGGASRSNRQKNYKIELASDAGLWRGQREINLNKHMWDLSRVRNKMSFDIFQTISHFTSLRTQFVQLYVNGEDYGLYTWIEEADKRFLASHGLDPFGQLYKAAAFHFQPIDPEVAADPEQMRYHLEPKANPDVAKLLRMVDAVNDPTIPIDTVIDTYFNRDNLVTWLAVNVLVNNIDTRTQNYYLYSPATCEGWYFLPWDYDGAWGFYGQLREDSRERWESGLSNWWPVKLFKRFFMEPANVEAIEDRIFELSETVLTDAVTEAKLAGYHDLVLPHISMLPDLPHLPGHHGNAPPSVGIDLWEGELARISSTVSRFRAEYLAVIERPMPSFLWARLDTSPLLFRWDDSYDLQHDPITYDFQISVTPAFEPVDVVEEQLDLEDDETTVAWLPPGTYWWRIIIRDHQTEDSWQLPFYPSKMFTIE